MNALIAKTLLTASAALAFGATMLPSAASAGEITNRFADQQARINDGIASGQMTRREFATSEFRLDRVEAQRRFLLNRQDGRLTSWQRYRLNAELNRNSNGIFFDNHNVARQPGTPLR